MRSTISSRLVPWLLGPIGAAATVTVRAMDVLLGWWLSKLGNDPERLVPSRDPLDIVERVPESLGPVLPGRPRRVGREGDVLQAEERVVDERRLLHHDVEARGPDLPRPPPVAQGLVLPAPAPAPADEARVLLHHAHT